MDRLILASVSINGFISNNVLRSEAGLMERLFNKTKGNMYIDQFLDYSQDILYLSDCSSTSALE